MGRSSGPAELFGVTSGVIGILSWLAPDWPIGVKIGTCVALLAPLAVHLMLPHEGKGLRLLLFAIWGAIQGAVVGAVIATAYFTEPVYKPVVTEIGQVRLDTFEMTGEHRIAPTGWVIAAACAGLGTVVGLYVRFRRMVDAGDEALVKNRLTFAALGLVALLGAGAAAYGYKYRERAEDSLEKSNALKEEIKKAQDPKNRKPPAPGTVGELIGPNDGGADMVMANDAVRSAEDGVKFGNIVFYVGIGVTCVAVLASVLFASYVVRMRQPPLGGMRRREGGDGSLEVR